MKLLILDATYLCHRAFHSEAGNLSNGTIFGFLRAVQTLTKRWSPETTVFCFDHGKSLREQKFSYYKETRRKKVYTDEEESSREQFRIEVSQLKKSLLANLGYKNVLVRDGYEADDLIAKVVKRLDQEDDSAVVVTGDHDMYQCLRRNVSVFHPSATIETGTHITKGVFKTLFGAPLNPSQWVEVKALAGCNTDDVTGVDGVGEKTAAKFVAGVLGKKTAAYKNIVKFRKTQQYKDNLELVTLPYHGCKVPKVNEDDVTVKSWNGVCSSMGMNSLIDSPPIAGVSSRFR